MEATQWATSGNDSCERLAEATHERTRFVTTTHEGDSHKRRDPRLAETTDETDLQKRPNGLLVETIHESDSRKRMTRGSDS